MSIFTEEKLSKIGFHDVIGGLAEGKTYQEIIGIPDEMMQEFYNISLDYLENQQYAEAADCFFFLSTLNPLQSNLWLKLGNAEYLQEHFEDALESYSMAALCDSDDPFVYIYMAYAYKALDQMHECKEALNIALHVIDEYPELAYLREQVSHLRQEFQIH
jgi:tetratricopeptide (TPR) repeat protein